MVASVKRLFTIRSLWLIIALAAPLIFSLAQTLGLVDFWIWEAAGEHLLLVHRPVWADTFSYAEPGARFINQAPLPEAVYALLLRMGGAPAEIVVQALLTCSTFGLIILLLLRAGVRVPAIAVASLVALVVIAPGLAARPQSFALLYLVAGLYALSNQGRSLAPIALFVLGLVWAYSHSSVAVGILLYGAAWLGGLLDRHLPGRRSLAGDRPVPLNRRDHLWRPPMLIGAVGLGSLLGPQGPALYLFSFSTATDAAIAGHVAEWQPLSVESWTGIAVLSSFAVVLLATVLARRPNLAALLPLIGALLLCLHVQRGVVWYALLLPLALAPAVDDAATGVLARLRLAGLLLTRTRRRAGPVEERLISLLALALLVALVFAVWPGGSLRARLGRPILEPDTPVGAVRYLQERHVEGDLFVPAEWSGYVLAGLGQRTRTYVDIRIEHFMSRTWSSYYDILAASAGWETMMGGARYAVLPPTRQLPLTRALSHSSSWRRVFEDKVAVVWQRSSRPTRSGVRRSPLRG